MGGTRHWRAMWEQRTRQSEAALAPSVKRLIIINAPPSRWKHRGIRFHLPDPIAFTVRIKQRESRRAKRKESPGPAFSLPHALFFTVFISKTEFEFALFFTLGLDAVRVSFQRGNPGWRRGESRKNQKGLGRGTHNGGEYRGRASHPFLRPFNFYPYQGTVDQPP